MSEKVEGTLRRRCRAVRVLHPRQPHSPTAERRVFCASQNVMRRAKSTNRGKLPWESTLPKLLLPNEVLGERNRGVFRAFKASNRNWARKRSQIEKFLNREISQLKIPGPRSEIVRLTLPYVKAGAVVNAAGLIQLPSRWPTLPD